MLDCDLLEQRPALRQDLYDSTRSIFEHILPYQTLGHFFIHHLTDNLRNLACTVDGARDVALRGRVGELIRSPGLPIFYAVGWSGVYEACSGRGRDVGRRNERSIRRGGSDGERAGVGGSQQLRACASKCNFSSVSLRNHTEVSLPEKVANGGRAALRVCSSGATSSEATTSKDWSIEFRTREYSIVSETAIAYFDDRVSKSSTTASQPGALTTLLGRVHAVVVQTASPTFSSASPKLLSTGARSPSCVTGNAT